MLTVCRHSAPVLRAWLGFDTDAVVHGSANPLLASEAAFGCLHRDMPEKELNLVQLSARGMAQLRARTPQIMRRYLGKAEFPRVLLHDMPDYPFRYAITPVFTCPTDTSEQSSGRNSGSSHPQIDRRFDPLGHRYSSNVPAFANEIDYGPVFFALLQMREVQIS